jgi:hypothetical protein
MIGIIASFTSTHMNKYFCSSNLSKALNAKLFLVGSKKVEGVDDLITIGMRGLETYSKLNNKNFKTVSVIFSDTMFCIKHKWCNDYVIENKIPVYAMPDLHDFLRCKYIPAYQIITCPNIIINKPIDRIIICHSPGIKGVPNWKGTNQIQEVINNLSKKYKIEYKLLIGLSNEQCIKEKSSAHIFIDQIIKGNKFVDQGRFGNDIPYKGGLGKSGIEGMCLGCCVITSMDEPKTEPYFPPPPIVVTDYNNFQNDLEKIIYNCDYRNLLIKKQKEWVDKYCSPEFVAMNVTRHIKKL